MEHLVKILRQEPEEYAQSLARMSHYLNRKCDARLSCDEVDKLIQRCLDRLRPLEAIVREIAANLNIVNVPELFIREIIERCGNLDPRSGTPQAEQFKAQVRRHLLVTLHVTVPVATFRVGELSEGQPQTLMMHQYCLPVTVYFDGQTLALQPMPSCLLFCMKQHEETMVVSVQESPNSLLGWIQIEREEPFKQNHIYRVGSIKLSVSKVDSTQLVVESDASHRHRFTEGFTIGTDASNQLQINGEGVHSMHAKVLNYYGKWTLFSVNPNFPVFKAIHTTTSSSGYSAPVPINLVQTIEFDSRRFTFVITPYTIGEPK